jgi:hypothetical protein
MSKEKDMENMHYEILELGFRGSCMRVMVSAQYEYESSDDDDESSDDDDESSDDDAVALPHDGKQSFDGDYFSENDAAAVWELWLQAGLKCVHMDITEAMNGLRLDTEYEPHDWALAEAVRDSFLEAGFFGNKEPTNEVKSSDLQYIRTPLYHLATVLRATQTKPALRKVWAREALFTNSEVNGSYYFSAMIDLIEVVRAIIGNPILQDGQYKIGFESGDASFKAVPTRTMTAHAWCSDVLFTNARECVEEVRAIPTRNMQRQVFADHESRRGLALLGDGIDSLIAGRATSAAPNLREKVSRFLAVTKRVAKHTQPVAMLVRDRLRYVSEAAKEKASDPKFIEFLTQTLEKHPQFFSAVAVPAAFVAARVMVASPVAQGVQLVAVLNNLEKMYDLLDDDVLGRYKALLVLPGAASRTQIHVLQVAFMQFVLNNATLRGNLFWYQLVCYVVFGCMNRDSYSEELRASVVRALRKPVDQACSAIAEGEPARREADEKEARRKAHEKEARSPARSFVTALENDSDEEGVEVNSSQLGNS